jgi:hypothetical protein
MREAARWVVLVLIALVLIGLVAYARGDEHHRGDDVGALGVAVQRSEVS